MSNEASKAAFAFAAVALGVSILAQGKDHQIPTPDHSNDNSVGPAVKTGSYTVPNPSTGYDPYKNIVPIEWYTERGMPLEVAAAQVNFDLIDADFVSGKATLNQRDQAGVLLEIAKLKASEPGENTANLNVLENLLAYLQSHPDVSRYDIRTWTVFP